MPRPKKYDIDPQQVEKMASYGMKNTEIADSLGCSKDLISKSYSTNITKGRADLKKSLRKAELDSALQGNATMLIWLGKQILDQSDKQEIDHNIRPIDEIEFNGI